jgi:hypothetical protein
MKNSTLILVGLTGLFLFVCTFFSNNPDLIANEILISLKVITLMLGSIIVVDFVFFLIVNITQIQGKQASDLVKLVISLLLYSACAIVIFQILGINITAIFTTSAFFVAIIGFSLRSTVENFVSGAALEIDKPFHIGDRVIIKGNEGEIMSITWRATTIRTKNGVIVQIPNKSMSNEIIQVIEKGGHVRREVDFIASGLIPPNQVIDTVSQAILNKPCPGINLNMPVQVKTWKYEIIDASLFITYRIRYYPQKYVSDCDRELLRRTWYALNRQQINSNYLLDSVDQAVNLIKKIDFFATLNSDLIEHILEHSTSILFDVEENINHSNLPGNSMFLMLNGCIQVKQKLKSQSLGNEFLSLSHRPKAQSDPLLDSKILKKVAYELAIFIGPTAFSIVQNKHHYSLYWLYQELAEEIQDLDQRQEFLMNCPETPIEYLQSGDCFGELSLFSDISLNNIDMSTICETKLLIISCKTMAALLKQDAQLIDIISHRFIDYYKRYLANTIQTENSPDFSMDKVLKRMSNF